MNTANDYSEESHGYTPAAHQTDKLRDTGWAGHAFSCFQEPDSQKCSGQGWSPRFGYPQRKDNQTSICGIPHTQSPVKGQN